MIFFVVTLLMFDKRIKYTHTSLTIYRKEELLTIILMKNTFKFNCILTTYKQILLMYTPTYDMET